jgi:hypothetical protein
MWVTESHLHRIDSALDTGPTPDVDRLLAEVLAGASPEPTPTVCAVCRRDLTRADLGHSHLVIYTCPAGHGAWLHPAQVATLQRLLHEGAPPAPPARGPRRLVALVALLCASLVGLAGTMLLGPAPAPIATASPMSTDERRYFGELVTVLDDGIMNRRNIDGLLKSGSRPDIYVSPASRSTAAGRSNSSAGWTR